MEVKINREIRNYTESMFFGLTMRQFVFSLLAVGVAVGLYFLLRPYCEGGFGASPNARGSAIFCTNIYSGQRSRYERRDILAVIEPEALAEYAEWSPWITEGLKRIEQKESKDKGGEAR